MLHLALVFALTSSEPSGAAPKTIVHTRSSQFCSVMRESVGRVVQGLIVNERLIDKGDSALVKMAHDYLSGTLASSYNSYGRAQVVPGAKISFDDQRLRDIAASMAHNLDVIDTLLSDPRLSQGTKSADDATLAKMKAKLERAREGQAIAVNLMSGLAETQELEMFTDRGNVSMNQAGGKHLQSMLSGGLLGTGPLDATSVAQASVNHKKPEGAISSDPFVNDPALRYADVFAMQSPIPDFYEQLLVDRRVTKDAEDDAASVIVPSVQACK